MKVALCAAWVASSLYFIMRIVSYNCMSAVDASRIQDIIEHLQIAQVRCLQETRFRAKSDSPYIGCRHDNFFESRWGYSRGTHTNRSTGCSTCFNNRFWNERDIAGILSPPKTLSGRGGAVRLRLCAADVMVMNLYFPARVVLGKGVQLYKKAVDELLHWAREALFLTKARSSIFICLDLNDKLGLPAPGEASQAVGLLAPGNEGYAAQGFRRLLNEFDLAAFNTWFGGQATYFGLNQHESRIDFVCGPRQMLPLCKNVPVLMTQGRSRTAGTRCSRRSASHCFRWHCKKLECWQDASSTRLFSGAPRYQADGGGRGKVDQVLGSQKEQHAGRGNGHGRGRARATARGKRDGDARRPVFPEEFKPLHRALQQYKADIESGPLQDAMSCFRQAWNTQCYTKEGQIDRLVYTFEGTLMIQRADSTWRPVPVIQVIDTLLRHLGATQKAGPPPLLQAKRKLKKLMTTLFKK